MKNVMKRTLALALAVIMLVSVMGITAFAEKKNPCLPDFKKYTVLGDSNPAGYGLPAYEANAYAQNSWPVKEWDLIEGSYPQLLAEALGLSRDQVNVCTHSCWRTNEFLYMIDPGTYTDYDDNFLRALSQVKKSTLNGKGQFIRNSIAESDLITVHFGSNDIFSRALVDMILNDEYADEFEKIGEDLEKLTDPNEFFNAFCDALDRLGILKDIIASFKAELEVNTANYEKNMVLVLDEIQKINPDAKIMVMSLSSPVSLDLRIDHEVVLNFVSSIDKRVSSVNDYLLKLCRNYDNCSLVEAAEPELYGIKVLDWDLLFAGDFNVVFSALNMVHPTEYGHQYLADQIVAKLLAERTVDTAYGRYSTYIKRNTINWTPIDGAKKYVIYRSTSENGAYKKIGTSTKDIYYDYLTLIGRTYYYRVAAVYDKAGTAVSPLGNIVALKAK